ncbi:Stage II sporulation protein E (SpoIIE) [Draconibacterium orientale]|uniref:Stage II sporulation protein E (SpoIIE) n=1 Tax=Draconibacterium orientale TaxID=1168034 RepID=A0A1I0JTY7_9BACT|nr:SpoIIE family protein phosphatase [Draconibacterium orientale]SEU14171.1 Stage II sporulation protein E (SpoIIE) [Draconibacterium orientale]
MVTTTNPDYHVEIEFQQKRPKGEIACGDVFQSSIIREEGRTILVLSDGIGHGIKASVLATLTSTMALKYSQLHTKPEIAARIIMETLPKSSDGKESYATFTIIELDGEGHVRIVNYDNPGILVLRNGVAMRGKEYNLTIEGKENQGKVLHCKEFTARKEDRIIFMSDGVPQSGLGNQRYPLGWGMKNIEDFALNQIKRMPDISATKLARKIVNQAVMNDQFSVKDDTSCGVMYFREPRKFMLITGPPFYKIKDYDFVGRIQGFYGKKIICGGTTAEIIARELDLTVEIQHGNKNLDKLPPTAKMQGFEMVTEGILTLGKVEEILENYDSDTRLKDSPPEEIVKLLLQHDCIDIIVGTRINWAHQDPEQPLELELRKFVVKRIVKLLIHKFFKKVKIEYI